MRGPHLIVWAVVVDVHVVSLLAFRHDVEKCLSVFAVIHKIMSKIIAYIT